MTNSCWFHFKMSQEVAVLLFDGPPDKQNNFLIFPNSKWILLHYSVWGVKHPGEHPGASEPVKCNPTATSLVWIGVGTSDACRPLNRAHLFQDIFSSTTLLFKKKAGTLSTSIILIASQKYIWCMLSGCMYASNHITLLILILCASLNLSLSLWYRC